ncbi:hypothetical protein AC249_AIPGENE4342 [Exaiptasia diaphana]|nr:hypothetical protein AC249_AIPGENE4342 [Exaiptasia diaphana]
MKLFVGIEKQAILETIIKEIQKSTPVSTPPTTTTPSTPVSTPSNAVSTTPSTSVSTPSNAVSMTPSTPISTPSNAVSTTPSTSVSTPSTPDPMLSDDDSTKFSYPAEDLLSKRKGKATNAQQTFSYVLKSSAKLVGIWEEPPLLSAITPKQMEKFFKCLVVAGNKVKVTVNKVEVTGNKIEYKAGVLPLVYSCCMWYKLQTGIGWIPHE